MATSTGLGGSSLDFLNRPLYSLAEASKLAGLTPHRTARWLRGYRYTYKLTRGGEWRTGSQGPIVKRGSRGESTYVSFLELVDLLLVKEFLARRVSLQRLRKALAEAAEWIGEPHFGHEKFFAIGKDIYLQAGLFEGRIMRLLSHGQWAIPAIIEELGDRIEFDRSTGFARRWFPLGKQGPVVVDPAVLFGRPSIVSSRVGTANVYDLYLGENKNLAAVSKWMRIDRAQAKAAVAFERQLAA